MRAAFLLKELAQAKPTVRCRVGDEVDAVLEPNSCYGSISGRRRRRAGIIGDISRGQVCKVVVKGQEADAGSGILVQIRTSGHPLALIDKSLIFNKSGKANYTSCRFIKCGDTDFGNVDRDGLPCSFYSFDGQKRGSEVYRKAMSGMYDVNPSFNASQMCCLLGGGSSFSGSTDLQQFPINLSLADIVNTSEFNVCQKSRLSLTVSRTSRNAL